MRWKNDQVCTTILRQAKHMCRNVTMMSLRTIQHSPSAWASFVPKLTTIITVAETKTLSYLTLRSFAMCSPIPRNMATPSYNTTVACKSLQVSASHFRMIWEEASWIPLASLPMKLGWSNISAQRNIPRPQRRCFCLRASASKSKEMLEVSLLHPEQSPENYSRSPVKHFVGLLAHSVATGCFCCCWLLSGHGHLLTADAN